MNARESATVSALRQSSVIVVVLLSVLTAVLNIVLASEFGG